MIEEVRTKIIEAYEIMKREKATGITDYITFANGVTIRYSIDKIKEQKPSEAGRK